MQVDRGVERRQRARCLSGPDRLGEQAIHLPHVEGVAAGKLRRQPDEAIGDRHVAELEEEQVDRVANSTRKRLARLLLILATLGPEGNEGSVLQRISEDMLAQILTTEPCSIHTLLQDFRSAGYLGEGHVLTVRSSLVEVLLPQEGAPRVVTCNGSGRPCSGR